MPDKLKYSDLYWKPYGKHRYSWKHGKECQLIWTANSSDFLSQNGNGLILESTLVQNLLSEILKMENHLKNATTKRYVKHEDYHGKLLWGNFKKFCPIVKKSFSKRIIFEKWLLHTDMTAFFGRTLVDFAW